MKSWVFVAVLLLTSTAHAHEFFAIQVVDDQTMRPVPLIELKTTNNVKYFTDSGGYIAFNEPGLMNRKVFFNVESPGYEFPADGFGIRGVALETKPGATAKLKIKRLNIAERLYRSTGQGVYRDTILLGRKAPIDQPVLNAEVVGQDSVIALPYRGRIFWFWGDTGRVSYALGQFGTSGATSDRPEKGGLDPDIGINFHYFTDKDGFSRRMAPVKEPGAVWLGGVLTVKDETGRERMLCQMSRMKDLGTRLERGLMVYNDEKEIFERFKPVELDAPLAPDGAPFRVNVDGQEYFYFAAPYPRVRVKADWKHVTDLSTYEAYTCLVAGASYDKGKSKLDRDAEGKLIFVWKNNTGPLSPTQQEELIKAGKMKREESPWRLTDIDTNKSINLHGSSIYFNDYRRKWIMIGLQVGGSSSFLGEVFFSEADKPEGPWIRGKKIVTHNKMDFYNPTQHPFFDQEGGKIIYFQGTYSNMFSGGTPTPWYEYNQVMYRLDLSDPRLKLD